MTKNKIKISLIGICAVVMVFIFAKNVTERISSTSEPMYDAAVQHTDENGISRSYFAKMISLLQYSKEELTTLDSSTLYKDVDRSSWYEKYINGLQLMNVSQVFDMNNDKFSPDKMVTYDECKRVVDQLATSITKEERQSQLQFLYNTENENKEITWDDLLSTYNFLVEKIYGTQNASLKKEMQIKELYIVGTSSNIESLEDNKEYFTTMADLGVYTNDGLAVDEYIDTTVEACVRGTEILYIKSTVQKEKELSNVWILGQDGTELEIYVNGVQRSFEMNNSVNQDVTSMVADVVVHNKKIKSISIKPDKISDKVLVAKEDYIELQKYGKIPVDTNYRIYKVYGDVAMEMTDAILVGYDNTDFVISNGKICAALITEEVKAQDIRVVLYGSNYKSLYHKQVIVTADKEFTISYGEQSKKYKAGKEVTLTASSELLKKGRVRIESSGEDGKIQILSIERKGIHPSYRGSIEVASTSDGLTIVNELPLEEYLYAVIPSEMPTSYGLEALKVQAVCARSYAYNHLLSNSCSKYGAHVDDSTTYQVYNGVPENVDSIKAVDETKGQVLEYDGKVIFAYYFSTSCGYTADVSNVWLSNEDLPYLKAVFQGADKKVRDYSKESAFREFITSNKEKTYESSFPWYRWTITIDYTDLKKMVDSRLADLYKKKSDYVLTLGSNGKYQKVPIDTVGTIKNVKISTRESSGLATEMVIEGSKNTIKVTSEAFIRQLLRPIYDDVIRQDGSKISGLSLLPSAFFVIDKVKTNGSVTGIKLSGGGYGHGVGMSQNGVKALADAGNGYKEILEHYYHKINIVSIY